MTVRAAARAWPMALFVLYAAWSVLAVVEIGLRRRYGHSTLPGVLADHNGNIAVAGFIMAAAFPGAWSWRLAQRFDSRLLAAAGIACVPLAAACFGAFFILMEVVPLYEPNVAEWTDIPGSVFGAACGTYFGVRFQRHMQQPSRRRRGRSHDGASAH